MESTLQVFDIQEKDVSSVSPPSFPTPTASTTGFPEHKKRSRPSAFKQRRQAEQARTAAASSGGNTISTQNESSPSSASQHVAHASRKGFSAEENRSIDRENKERIGEMSPAEIQAAQREIFNSLDPSLVQMLLKRANLDESGPSPFDSLPVPGQSATTISNSPTVAADGVAASGD